MRFWKETLIIDIFFSNVKRVSGKKICNSGKLPLLKHFLPTKEVVCAKRKKSLFEKMNPLISTTSMNRDLNVNETFVQRLMSPFQNGIVNTCLHTYLYNNAIRMSVGYGVGISLLCMFQFL